MRRVSRIAGFSLIEFAILMIIFGGLAAAATLLGDKWIEKEEHKSSKLNAKTVEEALDAYRKVNKRLPCPADPALNPGDAGFGEEQFTAGECSNVLPVAAPSVHAVVGMLPTKTLGLGENLVTDNWGNRFDYYLDKRMAEENAFSRYPATNPDVGDIVVRDESGVARTDKAIYAIVSRGANQRGAMTRAGTVKNTATTDLNEQANNHFNASGTASAPDNILVQASAGKDFDDIVMFKTRAMMALSGSSGPGGVPGVSGIGVLVPTTQCENETIEWSVGSDDCVGSVSTLANGGTTTVADNTAPTYGSINVSCNNGELVKTGGTCAVGLPCAAATVNWTDGAKSCSASVIGQNHGQSLAVTDSTAPQTGTGTATCNNGVWNTTGSCFNQCAATAHAWSDPDGSDCNGNVPLTPHGSAPVVASTGPGNGNVTATCNDGVFAYSSATCTDDADCLATTLPWTVGANSCSGTIAQTANAATATATDASHAVSPGGSGTANFTCNDGTWNTTPSAATCNAQCAANTQNWTVGGAPCSSAYAILNHDPATNVPLNDASAPSTGTANIRCNNGVVVLQSGSTCNTTCAAGAENWTQGANNCTAARGSLAGGASANLNDTTGPDTGSVTVTCNNATGAIAQSSVVCNAFVGCPAGTASWTVNDNCAAQVVSWTVGGRTCSGNAPATNDGVSTATITDATQALAPGGHGTATFTCNDGAFDVNAGATCESQCNVAPFGVINDNASVTAYSSATVACGGSCAAVSETRTCNNGTLSGTFTNASCSAPCASCPAGTLNWTASSRNCSDTTVTAGAHGATQALSDSTAAVAPNGSGTATATCDDGTWNITSPVCQSQCAAQTVSWTATSRNCSGSAALTNDGANAAVTDSTAAVAPNGTGSATFNCNNGTFSYVSGTCSASCAASQTVNWTISGQSCSASSGTILAHGGSRTITDSVAPRTGTRNISCNNGTIAQSGGSCTVISGCAAQAHSWVVNGKTCNQNAPALSNGASTSITDSSDPTRGSVTVTCSSGTLSNSNATCLNNSGGTGSWVNNRACNGTQIGTTYSQPGTWPPSNPAVATNCANHCASLGGSCCQMVTIQPVIGGMCGISQTICRATNGTGITQTYTACGGGIAGSVGWSQW